MHFFAHIHASVRAAPQKVFVVMTTWIHMLVLYMRKQVWTKHSEGQRKTQQLFHIWPKSLWLTMGWYAFSALSKGALTAGTAEDPLVCFPPVFLEVSVRGVFCSCLLLHRRKGDVRDAPDQSVQVIRGIAELLGETLSSTCPLPRWWVFPPLLVYDLLLLGETCLPFQNMRDFFSPHYLLEKINFPGDYPATGKGHRTLPCHCCCHWRAVMSAGAIQRS